MTLRSSLSTQKSSNETARGSIITTAFPEASNGENCGLDENAFTFGFDTRPSGYFLIFAERSLDAPSRDRYACGARAAAINACNGKAEHAAGFAGRSESPPRTDSDTRGG